LLNPKFFLNSSLIYYFFLIIFLLKNYSIIKIKFLLKICI
jgi:hypothetical protein